MGAIGARCQKEEGGRCPNTNNSTNIQLNLKSLLGMSIVSRRSHVLKKTDDKISHDTIPLKGLSGEN
jgi:hypothetical protein